MQGSPQQFAAAPGQQAKMLKVKEVLLEGLQLVLKQLQELQAEEAVCELVIMGCLSQMTGVVRVMVGVRTETRLQESLGPGSGMRVGSVGLLCLMVG